MRPRPIEPALFDAARRGDPVAREQLLDILLPEVLQWCARLGGPKVDAEDACHDVLIVLLDRLEKVHDEDRLRSWLFSVTRKVLAQHRRRAWVRRWVPGLTIDAPDTRSAAPDHSAVISQLGERIRLVLDELPATERECLVLFDLEERPEAEVAEILDVPIGTARSRVRSARERFRRIARRHSLTGQVVEMSRDVGP
jgi:RNA polymerase sigma-70 factor (ECF subfamily)